MGQTDISGHSTQAQPSWTAHLSTVAVSRRRKLSILVFLCLGAIWTIWLAQKGVFAPSRRSNELPLATSTLRNAEFSDAESPFIGWPLKRVCNETSWAPGVVFMCDNNSGGLGNIRNFILTCIRYSIEAGATGLIMPQIETRSEKDLSSLFKGYQPFSYFFDEDHFRAALAESCPQMTVYESADAVPNLRGTRSEQITPNSFGLRGGCDERDLNRHTDVFGPRFRAWLADTADMFELHPVNPLHPRLIRFNWGVQWDWPVWKDGPEFANTFGGLLRLRHDVVRLGRKTAEVMRGLAASLPQGGSRTFAGIHLRTENDALKSWPGFGFQASAYLRETSRRGLHAAYLATGNATEAQKFAAKAASTQNNLRVVTKRELLADHPVDLRFLESLTWDQQALVDFVVLLECDYFLGVSPSSFSINVAVKRHLSSEGLYTRPWRVGREGDGRSYLVGNYSNYWDDWLFMFDSIWP